ncbi:hypothetical protein [Actinophytocola xanthii]|uniref:Secreted protein n=1 Tax=Actinophytocola xanthii TaxID=1912961 RepID=A0A1Q8CU43_9PSEU|nr:hypothetical protein [Actinophytocola xanthii]OLF17873.1 hypothetical protein BU204_08655 [Actinophytocola xanthii]
MRTRARSRTFGKVLATVVLTALAIVAVPATATAAPEGQILLTRESWATGPQYIICTGTAFPPDVLYNSGIILTMARIDCREPNGNPARVAGLGVDTTIMLQNGTVAGMRGTISQANSSRAEAAVYESCVYGATGLTKTASTRATFTTIAPGYQPAVASLTVESATITASC